MADATLTSLETRPDGLHLIGSNFTQTTTTVQADGTDIAFTFISPTELLIAEQADGTVVTVTKNGVVSDEHAVGETQVPQEAPVSDQADIPAGGSAGNTGAVPLNPDDLLTTQEQYPPVDTPVKEPEKAVYITLGPKDPYPTGNPPPDPHVPPPAPKEEPAA